MYKVGLTGSIGVGKTTVSDLFASNNVTIIDADVIAKELTSNNSKYDKEIIKHFVKRVILNDELNRKALREIIFSDAHEKLWLENLLHPPIIKQLITQSDEANSEIRKYIP